jgi:hypothetical protein
MLVTHSKTRMESFSAIVAPMASLNIILLPHESVHLHVDRTCRCAL